MPTIQEIRSDFPILTQKVNGKDLVYLDNAATTQKPKAVIEALNKYYNEFNSNIHRGIHHLAEEATREFEASRMAIKTFIGAESTEEIILTYGTTDGLNLLANTYGVQFLKEGDEILISEMEHHSNIVPWQMLAEQRGLVLKVIPVLDSGELDLEKFEKLLSQRTKILSIVHVSNALGTVNPIKELIQKAHDVGAICIIDAAQSVAHLDINVKELNCDFMVFSSHKLLGPTGMGVLYGKKDLLNAMKPWRGGGEMIKEVSFEKTTYNDLPYKFEAGTPNIADVVAVKEAIAYIENIGKPAIRKQEDKLLQYATHELLQMGGVSIVGQAKEKVSVVSFTMNGIHPQDAGLILDQQGIAVRTGHHCTQPLMKRFGIPGTIRASFSFYNTTEEVDKLVEGLLKVKKFLL